MGAIASQITSLMIVYSIVCSDADQRKHLISALLAFVRGIHRGPVNSPHKWPVTRKMFQFDDVIMVIIACSSCIYALYFYEISKFDFESMWVKHKKYISKWPSSMFREPLFGHLKIKIIQSLNGLNSSAGPALTTNKTSFSKLHLPFAKILNMFSRTSREIPRDLKSQVCGKRCRLMFPPGIWVIKIHNCCIISASTATCHE